MNTDIVLTAYTYNESIVVKNAEGVPDTTATIIHKARINYTPKVSVIIPVYNTEKYLYECLESVTHQTLHEIEVICVDDGSTDGSLNILLEYAQNDHRFTVIQQENLYAGIARNAGFSQAFGEFVIFMDADDYYPAEDILFTLYTKAKKHNVYIAGGEFSSFTDTNKTPIQKFSVFFQGYMFEHSGVMQYKDYQFDYGYHRFIYNRNFLIQNKILFPSYKRFQDPPFFVKAMILAKEFYALKKITYAYRVSHKKVAWDESKTNDLLNALCENILYAKHNNLYSLLDLSCERFVQHYKFINKTIAKSSLNTLCKIILNIDRSMLKIKNKQTILGVLFRYYAKHVFDLDFIFYKDFEYYLKTLRIDYKNVNTASNAVICLTQDASVTDPQWLCDETGTGYVYETQKKHSTLTLQMIGDGTFSFTLRGTDIRCCKEHRVPAWIDCISVILDDQILLSSRKEIWHDKPFSFSVPVVHDQVVTLKVTTSTHKYTWNEFDSVMRSLCFSRNFFKYLFYRILR